MTLSRPALRVLYVEDNPTDADLTRRELARLAPEINLTTVETLATAIKHLTPQDPPYDVVLTDFNLPDGNGLDLLAYIRKHELPVAVVVITGSGSQENAVALLKAGADDYLVKKANHYTFLPHVLAGSFNRVQSQKKRQLQRQRVLYAEPNAFDADLTLRHLAQDAPHIQLKVVGSGNEILAHLPVSAESSPTWDVLLLDYRLPGLNALEVVKILRQERGLRIPIIMVTGQGSEEVAVQAMRVGIDDYLVKREGYLQRLVVMLENSQKQYELTLAEARYRNLFNSMRDVAIIADNSRRIIDANQPALRTLFGYETEEILGQSAEILYADSQEFERTGREVFNRQVTNSGDLLEVFFRRKSGEIFPCELSALKLSGDHGGPAGNIAIIRDITLRKQAEEDLKQRTRELEQRNEELQQFNYTVSHDLKTPLVTIVTFLDVLEEDLERKDASLIARDIDYIRTAAMSMALLLDDLQRLSRVSKLSGTSADMTFNDLTGEVLKLLAGPIALRGVTIEVDRQELQLRGDHLTLLQLWQNLLENAIKFMGEQSQPHIKIGVVREKDLEPVFYIQDNGIGIDARHVETIFGLFNKLSHNSEGSGIGLALAKRIVELHGGRIWVESAGIGLGSCFKFTLGQVVARENS